MGKMNRSMLCRNVENEEAKVINVRQYLLAQKFK